MSPQLLGIPVSNIFVYFSFALFLLKIETLIISLAVSRFGINGGGDVDI